MNIGVCIVNYNDSKNALKLALNISEFKSVKKIVIVDNNSNSKEKKLLKKIKSKKIKVIFNEANKGYASALNIGSIYLNKEIKDALICLANTDIKISSEEVLLSLASLIDGNVKCVMPKIKEEKSFKYGWKLTNVKQDILLNIPYFNRLIRNKYINYDELYLNNKKVIVDVIYGCFFMIDGNTLEEINYFDEGTFLYYEEYILARKLANINKKSILNNEVYVEHVHDAVIGNNVSNLNKYKIYKASQLYYEKKYNKANIFEILLFKLFYLINLIPYKIKSIKK